jgi:hypothetical protein
MTKASLLKKIRRKGEIKMLDMTKEEILLANQLATEKKIVILEGMTGNARVKPVKK